MQPSHMISDKCKLNIFNTTHFLKMHYAVSIQGQEEKKHFNGFQNCDILLPAHHTANTALNLM